MTWFARASWSLLSTSKSLTDTPWTQLKIDLWVHLSSSPSRPCRWKKFMTLWTVLRWYWFLFYLYVTKRSSIYTYEKTLVFCACIIEVWPTLHSLDSMFDMQILDVGPFLLWPYSTFKSKYNFWISKIQITKCRQTPGSSGKKIKARFC